VHEVVPRRPWLALALLVPVPTLGVLAAMVWPAGDPGRTVYLAAKAWLVALPLAWHMLIDRGRPGWSPPRRGGLGVGALLGIASVVVIAGTWWLARGAVDAGEIRREVAGMGLATRQAFLLGALGWIFVNSVMEEYVWRWFCYRQLETVSTAPLAVVGSAAAFTLHHVVALSTYLAPVWVAVASLGVFAGGSLWSLLYRRYRSVWPGWLAHAGADVAIFGIGWVVLFG